MKKYFALFTFGFLFSFGQAQPGFLDNTFGTGGVVATGLQGGAFDYAYSAISQPDGKIIIAGTSDSGTNSDFALLRLNMDGTLDNSFGLNGKVITPFGNSDDITSNNCIALQSDGKIIIVGSTLTGATYDFATVRYLPNGSLDTSFGGTGKVQTSIGSSDDYARAVAIQSDGKIVVAGGTIAANFDVALVRYNSNGSLDNSFGLGGIDTSASMNGLQSANSVNIQSDGKILIAGTTANTHNDFLTMRFNTDGTLDNTFGVGGIVTTPFSAFDNGSYASKIQTDGKIISLGYNSTNGISTDFALMRFNSDGTLDNFFGSAGKISINHGIADVGTGLALQADGKIVFTGTCNSGTDSFHVFRCKMDGSLDSTFGTNGHTVTFIANSVSATVCIQPNEKIVVAGIMNNGNDLDFEVARYNAFPLSVSNNSNQFHVNVFPNPSFDKLILDGTTSNGIIKIYSVEGKEILTQPSSENLSELNISLLPAGIYFIQYANENFTQQLKIIKD